MVRNEAITAGVRVATSAILAALALACGSAAAQVPTSETCFVDSPPPPKPPAVPAGWDPPKRPTEQTVPTRALRALNGCTLELYAAAKTTVRNEVDTLVIVHDSGATLFLNGQLVETKRILDGGYLDLRYTSHVPLAIYLSLSRLPEGRIDAEMAQRLAIYVTKIRDAKPTIDGVAFTADQKVRQHRLLETSLAFLEQVLPAGQVTPEALAAYARTVAADLEANIRDGGHAQVDGLHAALLGWRKNRLSDAQWCDLRFVLQVRQQARHSYGAVQYLAAVMRDPGDGRGYPGESEDVIVREIGSRIVDLPWDADFDLLGTIDLDAAASHGIFGDRDRLTVDVAADGARERVRELDLSELNRAACYR